MRWYLEENDVIIFVEGPKLWCSMAVMVVKDKQPFVTSCFSSRVLFKVLNLLKANLIGSPAIRTN
jgi:hypothetical protein